MSLAELFSSNAQGLSTGKSDTTFRFVSVDNTVSAGDGRSAGGTATLAVGIPGSTRNYGTLTGSSTLSQVIPTGQLAASTSASVMGTDLAFNMSAILNDFSDPLELIESGEDATPIRLNDLYVELNTASMGKFGVEAKIYQSEEVSFLEKELINLWKASTLSYTTKKSIPKEFWL